MYKELIEAVNQNEKIFHLNKLGMCREWSSRFSLEIKGVAEKLGLNLIVDVIGVNISFYSSHTFVKIWIEKEDENAWLCDGVGVGKYQPYFGPESEAPKHLHNSKLDMIEVYRRAGINI